MFSKKFIAATTLTALLAGLVPSAPALADGAASTRNIILGIGAATYLIIQHNRKVHQKYAEDARRQAAAEQNANDAWAAYSSEHRAYVNEAAVNSDLKREVAYQHNVVQQQQRTIAALEGRHQSSSVGTMAYAAPQPQTRNVARTGASQQVAMQTFRYGDV